jgi:hypothetical protein
MEEWFARGIGSDPAAESQLPVFDDVNELLGLPAVVR